VQGPNANPVSENETCPLILVVDDNELNRDALRRRLERDGYRVIEANDGEAALQTLRKIPVELVLLDIMMPGLDGNQVLDILKKDPVLRFIPVIMITANDDVQAAATCIKQGADDYLTKPFNPVLLRARVASCLERKQWQDQQQRTLEQGRENNEALEQVVSQQAGAISEAQMATIFAMSKLAESRDPETGAHLERVREYCRVLASYMQKRSSYALEIDSDFIENIYAASPLHDIGKVGVPDGVLLKPGKLDAGEWIVMKTHTLFGSETLRAVDKEYPGSGFIETGIEIAEAHHERWDGSGYPYGLKGQAIPLAARIMALGDVYDALTSKRCYKEAFSHEHSCELILQDSGKHFDAEVVAAFSAIEDEFIRIRKEFQDS